MGVKRTNPGPLLARLQPVMIPRQPGSSQAKSLGRLQFFTTNSYLAATPRILATLGLAQRACGLIAIDAGRSLPMINGNSTCD